MPGRYSVRHFHPANPVIADMASVCLSDNDFGPCERRADANEVGLLANALTAVALDAVKYDYPGIIYRELAPLQDGLTPGTETYQWDEYDFRGMAKLIVNYGDDLPNVSAYIKSNTGKIRSLGDAYEYTKQDVRRVFEARRNGRQAIVLDTDRAQFAREVMERAKDKIAAFGDTVAGLPGILKAPNVTLLSASAPGTGTAKRWDGADKTGLEIFKDFSTLLSTVRLQSKGIHGVNTVVMPVEFEEALAVKRLIPDSPNQISVLGAIRGLIAERGGNVEIKTWDKCSIADAAGTGPRVLAYERNPRNLRLVEPLDFEAEAPQRVNFSYRIPCESRFGGIYFKRPLSAAYLDFI